MTLSDAIKTDKKITRNVFGVNDMFSSRAGKSSEISVTGVPDQKLRMKISMPALQ
jgi:hypothetical protein